MWREGGDVLRAMGMEEHNKTGRVVRGEPGMLLMLLQKTIQRIREEGHGERWLVHEKVTNALGDIRM